MNAMLAFVQAGYSNRLLSMNEISYDGGYIAKSIVSCA